MSGQLPADGHAGPTSDELAALLGILPDAVLFLDEGRITWVNDALVQLIGAPREALLGHSVFELVAPEDREEVGARYRARLRGEAAEPVYSCRLIRADGTTFRAEIEARRLARGSFVVARPAQTEAASLAVGLGALAARVGAERSVDRLLRLVSRGLFELGYGGAAVERRRDRLVVHAVQPEDDPFATLTLGLGGQIPLAGVPLLSHPDLRRLLDEGVPLHWENFRAILQSTRMSGWEAAPLQASAQIHAWPLRVEGQVWGAVAIAHPRVLRHELESLALFFGNVSGALEAAVAFERLERRNRELHALQALSAAVTGELSLRAVLQVGTTTLAQLLDVPTCFVLLRVEDELQVVASNLASDDAADWSLRVDEPSLAGACLAEGRPLTSIDAPNDPRVARRIAMRYGHEVLLAVPLFARGVPLGAVVLGETRAGRRFEEGEIELVSALCQPLAAGVAAARLHEAQGRRVDELALLSELGRIVATPSSPDSLLRRALELIRSSLGFEAAVALRLGPGAATVVARSGVAAALDALGAALDPSLAARAIEANAPLVVRVTAAEGSAFACALGLAEVPGRARHALLFARTRRAPTSEELQTLGSAAMTLGLGLSNVELLVEARARVDELQLLVEVSRAVTEAIELWPLLDAGATALRRLVECRNVAILLLDPTTRDLRGAASADPSLREAVRALRVPLDRPSLAARALSERAAAQAFVGADDATLRVLTEPSGPESMLVVPLFVRGEPVGVVVLADDAEARRWGPDEIERVDLVGHPLAVAVANARLFDDLRRSYAELARTQEELVKRERLAALGELSAVVAHEVRNPLGVIFNSLGSLRRILRPTGDAAMLLDIVGEEADRLNRIVGDLLDFARPIEPALEAESIGALIEDCIERVRHDPAAEGVRVRADVPAELPPTRVDARMIRQVLLNVLLNGVQAMPQGGALDVTARTEQQGGRPAIRIDVHDSGPGIPPEFRPRIFQPFFTTKASGTGLGLAVVKRIIDAHRGEVAVDTAPGRGTTFTLRIPVDGWIP